MKLEHVNITVPDAKASAATLIDIFGWHTRWEGPSMDGGYTVHVGDDDTYLAYYSPKADLSELPKKYTGRAALNHVGVVVDDLDAVETKVKAAGYTAHSHYDYEPGHRFYFNGPDGIEFEVVSYA